MRLFRSKKLLLITLLVVLLWTYFVEQVVARKLIGVLMDEVAASCDCTLTHGRLSLSLLDLSATAHNVRLLENGVVRLKADELEAKFNLQGIKDKHINLERLSISQAHAIGVSEKSATYKLIDHLSAPIPPERDRPGRWKIQLQSLTLEDSSFEERIGSFVAEGKGVSLLMSRTLSDDFRLLPKIENLTVRRENEPNRILYSFGGVTSDLVIYSKVVKFEKFNVSRPGLNINGTGAANIEKNNALSGKVQMQCFNFNSITPPLPIEGEICADGDLDGNIAAPISNGDFTTTPIWLFDTITGQYRAESDPPHLFLKGMTGKGEGIDFTKGVFETDFERMKGSGDFTVERLAAGNVALNLSTIDAKIDSPYDTPKIVFNVNSPSFTIGEHHLADVVGVVQYQNGGFTFDVSNQEKSLFVKGTVPSLDDKAQISLDIKTDRFELPIEQISGQCSSLTAKAAYSFPLASFADGNGEIQVTSGSIGCKNYQINLINKNAYKVTNGAIDLSGSSLETGNSKLALQGQLSFKDGYDVKAKGDLPLEAFLFLAPALDDLSGETTIDTTVRGALDEPTLKGNLAVKNGIISRDSIGVEITDINGNLSLENERYQLNNFKGDINGGPITLTGTGAITSSVKQEILAKFQDAVLQPSGDLYGIVSGELSLTQNIGGVPVISGNLHVNNAEFQKNIDLKTIIDALTSFIISPTTQSSNSSALPNIDLNININAPSNLYIITNWLEAELGAKLLLTGSLSDPKISGNMFTRSGWFGVRERRFALNAGELQFNNNSLLPQVSLSGETNLLTRNGERVSVFVDLSGSIAAPKVNFTSDRGYSQQEILALLTGSSSSPQRTSKQTLGFGVDYQDISLLNKDSSLLIEEFLYNLTKIDTLRVEPSYNSLTGALEPSVIAEKRLTQDLTLRGEGTVSSNITSSEISAAYVLTPSLTLLGSLNSASNERQASAGVDLAYTIISSKQKLLELTINDRTSFKVKDIYKFLKLSTESLLLLSEIPELTKELNRAIVSQGYLDATVSADCKRAELLYCRELSFVIEEGAAYELDKITVSGDDLDQILPESKIDRLESATKTTAKYRENTLSEINRYLRSEGFISARVKGEYLKTGEAKADLSVQVTLGSPVTFIFHGNKKFTDYELLQTINLFERKQPFGNNSIKILADAIEQKYRQEGYLYASIDYKETQLADLRKVYNVEIQEEGFVPVTRVVFEGNKSLTINKLLELMKEGGFVEIDSLLSPKQAIDEDFRANSFAIQQAYIRKGFPSVKVTYDLIPEEKQSGVIVRYLIEEGQQLLVDQIKIEGIPSSIKIDPSLLKSISVQNTNTKVEEILTKLIENGFRTPTLSSLFDAETKTLTFAFTPGDLTKISAIKIEGNKYVKTETIAERLFFSVGNAYNDEQINLSRRKLLRLGLFSRVDITPTDGVIDSINEAVTVTVTEKPSDAITVGAGANSTYGLHLFGEALNRDFFADGQAISFKADIYLDQSLTGSSQISQGSANVLYTNPEFLDTDFSWVEELRFQRETALTQEFDVVRNGLSSYLYRAWDNGITFSFGHSFAIEDLNNVSEDAILSEFDFGTVTLGSLNGSIKYDTRDNPLNPRSGYAALFDYKYSAPAFGSDADFLQTSARFSAVYPLPSIFRRFSIALSSRIGGAWSNDEVDQIPITQRFYLGGRTSVRGFRENSLGPRGELGNVIGGDVMQANSLELKYLVANNTSLHTFLDSGNVFLMDRDVNLDHQRISTGIGVQYLSPIGPIGFDIGHPLDEKKGEPSTRFHFSIGASF